jgi:hypothetical protein
MLHLLYGKCIINKNQISTQDEQRPVKDDYKTKTPYINGHVLLRCVPTYSLTCHAITYRGSVISSLECIFFIGQGKMILIIQSLTVR